MMLFRIPLLMYGGTSGNSEMKVHFIPGCIQLQPMKPLRYSNKRKKNTAISLDNLENYFSYSQEGDSCFDGDEAQIKLQNAILQLPEKQRIVFNLKYFDEMTYNEMSKVLNTSEGALKASYHHAVKKIEKLLVCD